MAIKRIIALILIVVILISASLAFTSTKQLHAAPALNWHGSTYTTPLVSYAPGVNIIMPVAGSNNDKIYSFRPQNSTTVQIHYANIDESDGSIGSFTQYGSTFTTAFSSADLYGTYTNDGTYKRLYVGARSDSVIHAINLDSDGIPTGITTAVDLSFFGSYRVEDGNFYYTNSSGTEYLYITQNHYDENDSYNYTQILRCTITPATGALSSCSEVSYTLNPQNYVLIQKYVPMVIGSDEFIIGVGGSYADLDGNEDTYDGVIAFRILSDGSISDKYDVGTLSVGIRNQQTFTVNDDIYLIGGGYYSYDVNTDNEVSTTYTTPSVVENFTYNSGTDTLTFASSNTTNQVDLPFTLNLSDTAISSQINQSGTYYLYVNKYDYAGTNTSTVYVADLSDGSDSTPPVFNFTSSTSGTITSTTLNYGFEVTDNIGIDTVSYQIDSDTPVTLTPSNDISATQKDYSQSIDVSGYSDDLQHTITFTATDTSANEETQAYNFTIDRGPALNFTETHSGYIDYGPFDQNFYFRFSATDALGTIASASYDISDGIVDDNGHVLTPLDGEYEPEATENFEAIFNKDDFADKTMSVTFHVKDNADNVTSQTYVVQIVSDNSTPPEFNFSSTPEGTDNPANFGDTLTYSFDVSDLTPLNAVYYVINSGSQVDLTPLDGNLDEATESFSFNLTTADYTDQGSQTITFTAKDTFNYTATQAYTFNVISDLDNTAPSITFTESHTGLVPKEFTFAGTATDDLNNVNGIDWYVDGNRIDMVGLTSGTYESDQSVTFDQTFSAEALTEGEHDFELQVWDTYNNLRSYHFTIDVDASSPSCRGSWAPIASPHYGNHIEYNHIHCTDNRDIASAKFSVYHGLFGSLTTGTDGLDDITLPDDSSWGGSSEDISFSFDVDPEQDLDGGLNITFKVYDAAGNSSFDSDSVVIEYVDDTPPTLSVDPITPDPNTDVSPILTGTCGDHRRLDTNTNISNIKYRIDSGSWIDLTPIDGSYDSLDEDFAEELTGLSIADHTVDVSCTDGNSHTTTQSIDFTLIPIDESEAPGQFSHTDSFDNHTYQDTNGTDLIWGNGQLRLREDISTTRTLIDNTYFGNEYGDEFNEYGVEPDLLSSDILWYSKLGSSNRGQIIKYQISNNTSTPLDVEGMTGQNIYELADYKLQIYNGQEYMWIGDSYKYFVINLTNNTGIVVSSLSTKVAGFLPDIRGSRLATYAVLGSVSAGKDNLVYIDLNGTLLNTADDSAVMPDLSPTGFVTAQASNIVRKPGTNYFYVSHYGGDVYKFDDKNTPVDFSDDVIDKYSGYFNVFSGMTFDSNNNFLFGTAGNSDGRIFVVTNENDTPMDLSDDTVIQLNDPIDIDFANVYGLTYLPGQNNIGDQILIMTENGTPYYLNYNNTYSDKLDDTYIKLELAGGWRARWVRFYIKDYNTLYISVRHDGFYKVDLHRGWVDSGEAIGVPQRPSKKLILDNFVADATEGNEIGLAGIGSPGFDLMGALFPKVKAAGSGNVNYFISNDDGISWTPISLGELNQLTPKDYRVKFKITMAEDNGNTPVLENYAINFAGYATQEQSDAATSMSTVANPSNVYVSQNFALTITANDSLGFPQSSYNQNVTLSLINTSNNQVVTYLNRYSASLTLGKVILNDMKISQPGVYKIHVTDGTLSADSNLITVVQSGNTTPTPTLAFYADKYTIHKGESATLYWSSTNLSTLSITQEIGSVNSSGNKIVAPDVTTTYIINGSGNYGNLSSSLTITVLEDVSGEPISYPESKKLNIWTSGDKTVHKGETVRYEWEVLNADYIYIDFLGHEVSAKGYFEFTAEEDTQIVIYAKNSNEEDSKKDNISVIDDSSLFGSDGIISKIPGAGLIILSGLSLLLLITSLLNVLTNFGRITLTSIVNILRIIGIIPFKKRQGFVYDTKTGKPISFAVLNLIDASNTARNIITSIVTDLQGGYYEPFLAKGKYIINALHSEYIAPTHKERPPHLSIFDFYKSETLSITTNKDEQAVIIPMDQSKKRENEKNALWQRLSLAVSRLLVSLQWTVFPMFILSIYFLFISFNTINLLVTIFYLIIVLIKIQQMLKIPTLNGIVKDKETNKPISGAVIILKKNNIMVGIEKSDESGRFKFYVPRDTYTVHFSSQDYTQASTFGELTTINLKYIDRKEFLLEHVE